MTRVHADMWLVLCKHDKGFAYYDGSVDRRISLMDVFIGVALESS